MTQAKLYLTNGFGPYQCTKHPIPNGKLCSQVAVKMLRVIAMMDLMLKWADKNIFEEIEIF